MRWINKIYACTFLIMLYKFYLNLNTETLSSTEYEYWLQNFTNTSVIVSAEERRNLGLKDLAIATFVSKNHLAEAIKCCDSFQNHSDLKNTTFFAYLTEDVDVFSTDLYSKLCPVAEIKRINIATWPKHTHNLFNYQFKAIYQSIALQNRKMILTMDSSVRFPPNYNFEKMIKVAIHQNPLDATLLSKPNPQHSIYAVTDKRMYDYFQKIDINQTKTIIEYQAGLVLWIASENGRRIMKRYVECALKPDCMAPKGAKLECDMKILKHKPLEYAHCHRFDQSALNLILLEESMFNPKMYQYDNTQFSFDKFIIKDS